ncbi:MAG: hypothetical protein S4CHLAM102_12330 [Chlamydiia bacterium]|nr:hypothetical protein [Chlamydiia bacterium]
MLHCLKSLGVCFALIYDHGPTPGLTPEKEPEKVKSEII